MRTFSKFVIGAGALAALAVPISATAASAAPTAGGTATYTGQGFSAAADGSYMLNNQPTPANDGNTGQFADWDGPGNAYDAGDGYILWVLSANGAKSATITLPDGTTDDMKLVGGTFKYASPYFAYDWLTKVAKADYTGTVKGSVKLTASHGLAVPDSNVPAGVHWDSTNGGTVPATAVGDNPVFAYKTTQDRHYTWQCSLGDTHESVQHLVFTWQVDATPIHGDVTGTVVGYELTKTLAAGPGENYRTGTEQGTCPDGGDRTTWLLNGSPTPYMIPSVHNIASGLTVNGAWLPNAD